MTRFDMLDTPDTLDTLDMPQSWLVLKPKRGCESPVTYRWSMWILDVRDIEEESGANGQA